ncbi:carboxypeptidase N subunit 2-like isoform X2 [Panonychus citri]|uniref:carboxypeptidase N subunit 2-like isoform X2 n=1 Tax=Panonychus citri TaxID=50023 RepID=UPI002307CBFF|nr:carboxypeptidase N subunit 2-like isoform X2 [Panonychus citri]
MILNLIYLFCVNSFLQLTVIIVISSANPSISLSSSSSDSVNHLNLNNHNKLDLGSWQRCIKSCVCDMDETKRKRVICESGKLTRIPTNLIDPSTKILIVDGKPDQENSLNLGKIFNGLTELEEIKISHSRLPAIGESSFWPGYQLRSLDLSYNSIGILSPHDFYNLSRLINLDLSNNRLDEFNIPSAPFNFLISLEKLSLARNKIRSLVPRMFYPLSQLTNLDLSGNPLSEIKAEYFTDLPILNHLSLENCGLKDIPASVYKNLNNLNYLNLKDGNKITVLSDHAFDGLQLTHLGLSSNSLTGLSTCTFCSSTVDSLDLSHNSIRGIVDTLLEPISNLTTLNFNNNPNLYNPGNSVANLIRPLKNLQHLSLAETQLDDSLNESTFNRSSSLLHLDLSRNKFTTLQASLFKPLYHLEALNLSHNLLSTLESSVLETFDSMTTLRLIALHNNPWSCSRCHILPLINWLNQLPSAYSALCVQNGHNAGKFCVKCSSPSQLEGRPIYTISDDDIDNCQYNTKIQMRLTYPQPKIGMVLGFLVVISLTFLIIIIALIYRRQGAVYYTNEKETAAHPCLAIPEDNTIDDNFIIDCTTDGSDCLKQQLTNQSDKMVTSCSPAIILDRPNSPIYTSYHDTAINNQHLNHHHHHHYITTINNPSNLSPYSTYTSFEPRLRY